MRLCFDDRDVFTMSTPRNVTSKHHRPEKVFGQGGGPSWILIAGGALLSTLSIRFGYKLKQSLHFKPPPHQSNASVGLKANGTSERQTCCCLHSNTSSSAHNKEYSCFRSIPGTENVEGNEETNEQMVSTSDTSLPLVTVPAPSYSKENGVMWTSSPDRLELPPRPYNHHHSTCSDSPCVSETSSDIFSKREVIQKLRQQLKRRDDMILEMQEQILELQNSYNAQMSHSSHLQAQLDSMNRDLFESEREVERLRKAIADHSLGCAGSNGKTSPVAPWSGHVNGFMDSENNYESPEKLSREGERIEMLRKEVSELKEVIDGKDYLLKSYKEQKMELQQKVKELQQRLDSQLPNIL
ncbi:Uncharacterized protein Rs2_07976 [Raphanus sativus]|uniref:Uncharacterized protein LOC108841998 n=1 Tax=Raphanus sativus TaxID=3726 RepID=A0A6J0MEC5_RAPSA|nr:uncharacterized protein LOC108841998 [Raphanus sativus]XP_056859288.1 uncharacterized protein LOC130508093 [Raphanus sativus]KAJ4913355.1 Uncharacterized protein Rs2_07976 [Raphanus sativus]